MADFWKSLPRKFCDFCKCWLTDNKPSIEFHERGRKHQENVQKKIAELRRKGQKALRDQRNTDKMMQKIEEAAMKAFQNDVANNPDLSAASGKFPAISTVPITPSPRRNDFSFSTPKPKKQSQNQNKKKQVKTIKTWFESKTEDGHIYYWNSESGESKWEMPLDGYISIKDQEQPNSLPSLETEVAKVKVATTVTSEAEEQPTAPPPTAPTPKSNPYGKWTVVTNSTKKPIDLQLPKRDNPKQDFRLILPAEEPQMKFKEKVATSITNKKKNAEVEFKKRKVNCEYKKNFRRRVDEEEDS